MANPLPSSTNNPPPSSSLQQLVLDLLNPQLRQNALHELSRKRDNFQELAPLLWHSVGTISTLLQEIIVVYPYLFPPTLTLAQSIRLGDAIVLLQCVASSDETRRRLLSAQITAYLLPLMNTSSKSNPFVYMRMTCLGVICQLVKAEDKEVIRFLLSTEIVPACFRAIEHGTQLTKCLGTFIIQHILEDELGLDYICSSGERFFCLNGILKTLVEEGPSPKLLKIIIRCYLRLTAHQNACHALGICLPMPLWNPNFTSCLLDDQGARQCLQQLLHRVSVGRILPPVNYWIGR